MVPSYVSADKFPYYNILSTTYNNVNILRPRIQNRLMLLTFIAAKTKGMIARNETDENCSYRFKPSKTYFLDQSFRLRGAVQKLKVI